jgi:hypothetical protein
LAFLVQDFQRNRFASMVALQNTPLKIGIQAIDDIAP